MPSFSDYFKNATESPKICNSKCADDPSKTCKALLYPRPNVLCSGDSIESKPCQEAKRCIGERDFFT